MEGAWVFCLGRVWQRDSAPTLSSGEAYLAVRTGGRPSTITSWRLHDCYQADLYVRRTLLDYAERRATAAEAKCDALVAACRTLLDSPADEVAAAALRLLIDPPPEEDDCWC